MAQKIYDAQIPAYLYPRVAEHVFRCNENDLCFLVFWTKNDQVEKMLYL